MKYIKRILMLPFAVVLWLFYFAIDWVKYGGELRVNNGKPVIKPEEFYKLLIDTSSKLSTTNDKLNKLVDSYDNLSEDEICKQCQFWEIDDCKDFKGYKTLILNIQDKIDNSPITVTNSSILNKVTELINQFFKIK